MNWRLAGAAGLLLSLALMAEGCQPQARPSGRFEPRELASLLGALSGRSASPQDLQSLVDRLGSPDDTSPMWPVHTYLRGEALWRLNRQEALRTFKRLARWGADRPQSDRWGGSSLAFFGLWRWIEALEAADSLPQDEVDEVLRLEAVLRRDNRLVRGLLAPGVLDSLPLLEEDSVRRLAAVALRAGRKEAAQRLSVEYLTLSPTADIDAAQEKLLEGLVRDRVASREVILALRAERLESLQKHRDAERLWQDLEGGASLHLAKIQYLRVDPRQRSRIAARLDVVLQEAEDPNVVQEALLTRAMNWSRDGTGQDYKRYFDDLRQIVERFPQGLLADDALYHSALMRWRLFETEGSQEEFAAALEGFRRLREFQGRNDWLASAHFFPALALIQHGREEDLHQAVALLERLNQVQPTGELHRHAAFWRARALEALGSTDSAAGAFREVLSERPFDYYGLRAAMHGRLGAGASSRLWPDPETRKELLSDLGRAGPDPELTDATPYHARLRTALEAGLYARAVAARAGLRTAFPGTRISDVPLDRLEQTGLLPSLALFLSLRQDAWVAAEAKPEAANYLGILAAVGDQAADWPLATALAVGVVPTHGGFESAQSSPPYLRSAYRPVFRDVFSKASGAYGIPVELLYALARRESLLDPEALSPNQALGLFQFLPTTFDGLDKGEGWNLLAKGGVGSRDEYLLRPDLSAELAARWFSKVLIPGWSKDLIPSEGSGPNWFEDSLTPQQERAILFALMEHNAGKPQLRTWIERWRRTGRLDDIEYMVETAGAAQTRLLVRGVWTDASIASAVELLAPAAR